MARKTTPPDPQALVRVRDAQTGHAYTVPRFVADLDPERYALLDEPATDRQGIPLPPSTLHTSDAESDGAADQAADNPVTA